LSHTIAKRDAIIKASRVKELKMMKRIMAILAVVVAVVSSPIGAQIELGPRIIWGTGGVTHTSLDVKLFLNDLSVSGYAEGEVINAIVGLQLLGFNEQAFGLGVKLLGGAALDPNAIPAERIQWQFGTGMDFFIRPFYARVYADHLFKWKGDNIQYVPSVGVSFDILKVMGKVTNTIAPQPDKK